MSSEYIVDASGCGVRLDRYVRAVVSRGITQSLLEKLLRVGDILLNDKKVKASVRLRVGDVLRIFDVDRILPRGECKNKLLYSELLLSKITSSIIYEDDDIVAINKPAGISTQGGSRVKFSISDTLDRIRPGEHFHIVHRLDKDTSGVLVLARNKVVARCIAEAFRNRMISKEYLAITTGVPYPSSGEIDIPIFYKSNNFGKKVEKKAKTSFITLKSVGNHAMVLLRPITGRKHQLRVHMHEIGCPILGDKKYQGCVDDCKLHLHASAVVLVFGGHEIRIAAPIPDYMENTIKELLGGAF